MFDEDLPESQEIADEVRQSVRIEEMQYYGKNKIPCGPNVFDSDAIVVVEGRADVLNLLRYGIKNTICVGGTNVPPEVAELTKKKTVTAFTDGDRGGKLIIKELLQVADIDYVARAPDGKSVEDLVQREIVRSLRQKVPVEQVLDSYSIKGEKPSKQEKPAKAGRIARLPKRKERVVGELSKSAGGAQKTGKKAPRAEEEPKQARQAKPVKQARQVKSEREVKAGKMSPQARRFKPHSDELIGTLGARLLDSKDKVVEETAVRDLVNTLKGTGDDIKSVVFDGVVTQRILDIASDKGIENLIGVKKGNIAKSPAAVNVLTASDF